TFVQRFLKACIGFFQCSIILSLLCQLVFQTLDFGSAFNQFHLTLLIEISQVAMFILQGCISFVAHTTACQNSSKQYAKWNYFFNVYHNLTILSLPIIYKKGSKM